MIFFLFGHAIINDLKIALVRVNIINYDGWKNNSKTHMISDDGPNKRCGSHADLQQVHALGGRDRFPVALKSFYKGNIPDYLLLDIQIQNR